MSEQKQGWITLESCILDYMNEAELNNSKYVRLFHLAYRVMENLGIDFFYQIKTVKLQLNANKTVTLPDDFRHYNKVGILNGIGELVPLKYNEKLTTFADLKPTRVTETNSSNFANYYSFSSPIFFNFWDGTSYNNLYGLPGSYIYAGGFKIDTTNGVILFDSAFNWTNLILEYTANPEADQDYYIPSEFREAVIAWLAWKDIANISSSRKGNLGDKRDRRHEYFEARRLGIRAYRPFYLDQAYIQNVEAQRLCVKV